MRGRVAAPLAILAGAICLALMLGGISLGDLLPDFEPPETTIDSGPSGVTNTSDAVFQFSSSETGSTFECQLDGAGFQGCSSPQTYNGLSDTPHTFEVRATDGAGNTDLSPARSDWTVDTSGPDVLITSGPEGTTNSSSAGFEFSASESGSSFECQLDAGTWQSCSSGQTYNSLSDAEHTFQVRATDGAGNTGAPSSRIWTIDTSPPAVSITSGPSGTTNSTTASFEFSATEPALFECQLDGGAWETCGSGYTYFGLSDAQHTFRVRATDGAGNRGPAATRTWTIDTSGPAVSITSGPSGTTNSSSARFEFSAGEPATFQCQLDGGGWQICSSGQTYHSLSDAEHTFQVRATDGAANTGAAESRTWTVDTTAPDTTISSGPSGTTNSTSARFEFSASESGSSFECQLDSGTWQSCSSGQTYNSLSDAQHTFRVRATDGAGNRGPGATRTWTIDTSGPAVSITSGPSGTTNSSSAQFEFSAGEPATFQCQLDGGGWLGCSSGQTYNGLSESEHTFQVRATDGGGNTGTAVTRTWTVDATPPNTTINSGPQLLTNSTEATFTFSSSEPGSGFQCQLDGGAWELCSSPLSYASLSDGSHTFRVRATDQAGNTDPSEASHDWTVITSAPETRIDTGPSGPTSDNTPTFTFSSPDDSSATFECKLDGPGSQAGSWGGCSSPKTYGSQLGDGSYTFLVRAKNVVGNVDQSPDSRSFTVDTAAPDTIIDTAPPSPTSSTAATFTFSSTEPLSSFECKLEPEQGGLVPCASGITYTNLSEGLHTFRVRATDQAGNTDSSHASRSFTVDTTPPDTTIDSGPSGTTPDETPTFTFSSTGGGTSFECRVDGAAFEPCSGPGASHTTSALANGLHVFYVRAKDAAGNVDPSPDSQSFTVNTVAPQTFIDDGPSGPIPQNSVSFRFSSDESGVTFQCKLDGPAPAAGSYAACLPPIKSYSSLVNGFYSFSVRAIDADGNIDQTPAIRSFTVDTVAPNTSITSGPSGTVNSNLATFSFTSTETNSTFECKLDTGGWESCLVPKSYGALSEGGHTFRVRAKDEAGNTDAVEATRSWTVDTLAPDTTITSGPTGPTNTRTVAFQFASTESPPTFECKLDGPGSTPGSYLSCTSTKTYNLTADGAYTVSIRALDAASNPDPTPATRAFTVDTTLPTTTITSKPAILSSSTSASFEFSPSEPGSFQCKLDTQDYAPCTSPNVYNDLTKGSHTFKVRAVDQAGNVGSPVEWTWTIDTDAPHTTIVEAPPATTNLTSAEFKFSANEPATFTCQLDGGAWQACGPAQASTGTFSKSYSGLSDGQHSFAVQAIDEAGKPDPDPETRSWTIDLAPPETTITSGPFGATTSSFASFAFSSESGATFECRLDGGGWNGCTSPKLYGDLGLGQHSFEVRAADGAGNRDPSAASRSWTIQVPTAPSPSQAVKVGASGPRLLTPFPVVRIAGTITRRGVRLRLFVVDTPADTRVTVRCVGRRCPFGRRSRTAANHTDTSTRVRAARLVRIRRLEKRFYPAGVKIEVFITKRDAVGKYTRFKVRKGKPPARIDRCLMPGSKTPARCPVA